MEVDENSFRNKKKRESHTEQMEDKNTKMEKHYCNSLNMDCIIRTHNTFTMTI
jgi:hypothetical protein